MVGLRVKTVLSHFICANLSLYWIYSNQKSLIDMFSRQCSKVTPSFMSLFCLNLKKGLIVQKFWRNCQKEVFSSSDMTLSKNSWQVLTAHKGRLSWQLFCHLFPSLWSCSRQKSNISTHLIFICIVFYSSSMWEFVKSFQPVSIKVRNGSHLLIWWFAFSLPILSSLSVESKHEHLPRHSIKMFAYARLI